MGSLAEILALARKKPLAAVLACSLSLAATAWMALALADYYRLPESSFWGSLVALAPEQLLPRLLITALFLVFGGYAQWVIIRRSRAPHTIFGPETLYRTLLNTTPEAVLIADVDGSISFISLYISIISCFSTKGS